MSTTVKYKGSTIATISNETKKLTTKGTWLEGDIEITDASSDGIDMPVFTIQFDSNYNLVSVTCNETFAQCYQRYTVNNMTSAYVYMTVQGDTWTFEVALVARSCSSTKIIYSLSYGVSTEYDIIYNSDGTIEYVTPSPVTKELSVTSNGYYHENYTVYSSVSVNVPSGGSSMNVQAYRGYDDVINGSYIATDVTLTVAKSGTYTISWVGWRNTTGGTSGSQLYKNGTAVGSANTTFIRSYGQVVTLTNQSLSQGDVLVVWARSRSASYYMCVGNLIIEQTA